MNKFQVDPRVQMLLSFVVGVVGFAGSTAGSLPGVPQGVNDMIHAWALWALTLYTVVIAPLLLAYTNSNPGPLAPPDPPSVKAAQAMHDQAEARYNPK